MPHPNAGIRAAQAKRRRYRYRRRGLYKKKRYGARKLHGVKKFVSTHKWMDVVSAPTGTNVGGYARHNLAVSVNMSPIHNQLAALYKQFMITGIAWQYRPTNISPNQDGNEGATQMLFVEDKDSTNAITVSQAQSQDNVRNLITSKPFKHYIRLPRPELFNLDLAGRQVFATQGARFGTWLSFGEVNNALKHLNAQMLIADAPGAAAISQGQLWVKIYLAVKEQCLN